jgi:Glycosyl transferase family 2
MAVRPLENDLDLTLFVACYNEEENIVGTLETVLEALGEFDFTWEIIVIDDASTDRSRGRTSECWPSRCKPTSMQHRPMGRRPS